MKNNALTLKTLFFHFLNVINILSDTFEEDGTLGCFYHCGEFESSLFIKVTEKVSAVHGKCLKFLMTRMFNLYVTVLVVRG